MATMKPDTGAFWEPGRIRMRGRTRRLVPFKPVRVLIAAGIVWTLFRGLA